MAILSIQSHVVFGYAGNTAAVFPMQRLGREVWAVNTVEFSNHTGYGSWTGKVLGAELASELVKGVENRGALPRCEAVLSGYLGDASVGKVIADTVKLVRGSSGQTLYCCDPVIGDVGRGIYVKDDIPGIFRNELCPLADIVTPNQFELEVLTGIEPDTIDNTRRAIDALHKMGPPVVLVTSYFDGKKTDAGEVRGQISMLVSDSSGLYRLDTPELPLNAGIPGSGDLTASVFLSRFLETRDSKKTLELCASSIYGILEKSFEESKKRGKTNDLLELLIVREQAELETPSRIFEAVKL